MAVERTLVTLGAAVWPGDVPSPTLRRRTEWAAGLFQKGGYDLVVMSGAKGRYGPAEADVMVSIARGMGIPASSLVADTGSFTTMDTARFAATMPDAAHRRFVAVTDIYHAPRTWLAFRTFALDVRVSCPPLGRGTRRARLAWSFLRELPALALYALRFPRERLRSRR